MPLTDNACRNAKPATKPKKISDGGGLYLFVHPNGSKLWRMNYRFEGKQKTLSFGPYPTVTLAAARARQHEAKAGLAAGRDPSRPPEVQVGTATFEAVAREWWQNKHSSWKPSYAEIIIARFEADLFPEFGDKEIDQIDAPVILDALRKVEGRGARELASRLLQMTGSIFRYAIATGRARRDPAADLRGALKAKPRATHLASLKASELPDFFNRLTGYDGDEKTRLALELLIHTMTRTNEIRFGRWKEIEGRVWRIPAERMKARREHLIPLSPQAVALLDRLRDLSDGSEWIAPGRKDKPMSENTLLYALYRLGFHSRLTVHGFRSTASTVLNESGLWGPDAIERQLAHVPGDGVRAAYNSALYMVERTRMLEWWSAFLDDQRRLGQLLG